MTNAAQVSLLMNKKSTGVALLLTFLFGPLGLFYASVVGGVVMLLLGGALMLFTLGFGGLLVWPVCMIWAAVATSNYNKRLVMGLASSS